MRRLIIVLSAAISASILVSFAALAAGAQTPSQQYATEDSAQEEAASKVAASADSSPSQGSYTEGTAGPNEPSLVDDTPPTAAERSEPLVTTDGRASGRDVVRAARRYIGTRYRYSTCTKSRMSCTCLTKRTWAKFGHKLPMTENGQWKYEPSRKVAKSNLRKGDIVYFKEAGRKRGITHVGIYSGRGNLVHASAYFNKVVESKMRYIKGYFGATRLRPR